jgi:hypothetical protein
MRVAPARARSRALTGQKREAIRSLDFERAYNISREILQVREGEVAEQQRSFFDLFAEDDGRSQRDIETQQETIFARCEDWIAAVKCEYQQAAQILAQKHRREAQLLTDKWRALHRQAQCDAHGRAATYILSARILAECDSFESAIDVRDGAEEIRAADLSEYCAAYRQQFQFMLRRHEAEFDQLHTLLKNYVFMRKLEAEELMLAAEEEHMRVGSEQSANRIGNVLQAMDSSAQRTETIHQISTRMFSRMPQRLGVVQGRGEGSAGQKEAAVIGNVQSHCAPAIQVFHGCEAESIPEDSGLLDSGAICD